MRIVTIVGARPQFIKAAAVSRAISQVESISEIIIHTGQHFDNDMYNVFFEELKMPLPKYELNVNGGGHGSMTGRMLIKLEDVLITEKPDLVLLYGDTNSTLAGAISASKLNLPIAHVEAGLRSFNNEMPEEINRILSDRVSRFLFCPTREAIKNLENEGIREGVFAVGDVMFDATLYALKVNSTSIQELTRDILGKELGSYILATVHREENTSSKNNLRKVFDYVRDQSNGKSIVLPLHPRTQAAVKKYDLDISDFMVCKPVNYGQMALLVANADLLYTDSGGLQKEAYFHRTKCVTLRAETEWVETIHCGWNRLWTEDSYADEKDIADYGSGKAAEEIVSIIIEQMKS